MFHIDITNQIYESTSFFLKKGEGVFNPISLCDILNNKEALMTSVKAKKHSPLLNSKEPHLKLIDKPSYSLKNGALRTEELIQNDPDIKSFIYQQIAEFQPFVTPTTVAAVIAKDPQKLAIDFEISGDHKSKIDLARLHRISILLRDEDSQIHEEASHENIFEAIRLAKTKLLGKLTLIQDQVISKEDRIEELQQALQNQSKH